MGVDVKEFLDDLNCCDIHITDTKKLLSREDVNFLNGLSNIYFVAGVKSGYKKRVGAEGMFGKSYVVIDVDLRKQSIRDLGYDLTNEEIKLEGENIIKYLAEEDELLGSWRYVVYSGGGLHIYYKLPSIISIDENYGYGSRWLFKKWNEFWGDKVWEADFACSDLPRIFRLPGTINLGSKSKCEILARQDKILPYDLNIIAEEEKIRIQKERELELKKKLEEYEISMKMDKLILGDKYESNKEQLDMLFKKIDSIPAYLVSEKLLPQFILDKNGKNFLSDKPNKGNRYTGFYYEKNMNIIINGGSSFYNYGDVNSGYSNSVLVKHFYNFSWKEVIEWFKQEFSSIVK